MNKIFKIGILLLLLLATMACEEPWEKHISKDSLDSATSNMMEIIKTTPNLKSFAELIEKAGLSASFEVAGAYTIWAPSNTALASLSDDIKNDPAQLKTFINNHITASLYPVDPKQITTRCTMLNGKHVDINMSQPSINDVVISGEMNQLATNGIVHIIEQTIQVYPSIWEYIENSELNLKQIEFLNSISDSVFSEEDAIQLGFDPVTSQALYDTLSGMVWYNPYVSDYVDLRNEDSLFTFFILEDNVYEMQHTRFAPYYNLKSTDERDPLEFSNFMVCYDLVGRGIQTTENTNGYLNTMSKKKVPFSSSAIIETIKTSNGTIYRLNTCDLSLEAKFPPVIVEGEDLEKVLYIDGGKTGYTRVNPLASSGFDFVLDDHDANPARIVYNAGDIAACKYEFYWVAVDDFNSTYYGSVDNDRIRQKIEKVIYIPNAPAETMFPVHYSISDSLIYVTDTTYEMAEEHYVGSADFKYYEDLWIHLIGSGKNTALTLDYIKIKPVFDE